MSNLVNNKLKLKIILIIILNIMVGIGTMIPIFFMQRAIDNLLKNRFDAFLNSIILYILIYTIVQLTRTIVSKNAYFLEINYINFLRTTISKKILNTRLDFLEKEGGYSIHEKLVEDFSLVEGRTADLFLNFTFSLSSGIVGILIFAYYDLFLLIILIPLSFLTTLIVNHSYEKADTYSVKLQKKHSILNKEFRYIIVGARDIILYGRDNYFLKRLKRTADNVAEVDKENIKLQTLSQNTIGLSFNILIGLLILIGGFQIKKGYLTIGALVAVIMYNSMVTDPIFNLIDNQKEIFAIKNAFKRIKKIYFSMDYMDSTSVVDLKEIELKNINLNYGHHVVLSDFNLKIKNGDCIRIIGKTGSGKSSVAKLITGLYKPTSGRVLFNGKPNQSCTMASVFQNNILFNDSIENNIKFFRDISDEKYKKVIEMTYSEEILEKHGSELIGEDGNKLSGGEKTRILVARALLQEADLYIFDEISTGLDEVIFKNMSKNIMNYLKNKTMIFIDHREIDSKYFSKSIFL